MTACVEPRSFFARRRRKDPYPPRYINLRYLDIVASSCDRRCGSGPPLRDTGGHVYRVPDAQEGRGLVRPGRAKEIARGAGLPQAWRTPPQSGVLRLRRRRRDDDDDLADSSRDLTMPSRVRTTDDRQRPHSESRWSMVIKKKRKKKRLLLGEPHGARSRAHRLSRNAGDFCRGTSLAERRPILADSPSASTDIRLLFNF